MSHFRQVRGAHAASSLLPFSHRPPRATTTTTPPRPNRCRRLHIHSSASHHHIHNQLRHRRASHHRRREIVVVVVRCSGRDDDGVMASTDPLLGGKEEEEGGGEVRRARRWWVGRVVDTEEAWAQTRFAVPMVLTNMSYYAIPLVSVMFSGHLGDVHLAGATLGNSWATVTGYAFVVRTPLSLSLSLSLNHTLRCPALVVYARASTGGSAAHAAGDPHAHMRARPCIIVLTSTRASITPLTIRIINY
jgi:hypothetical protein